MMMPPFNHVGWDGGSSGSSYRGGEAGGAVETHVQESLPSSAGLDAENWNTLKGQSQSLVGGLEI